MLLIKVFYENKENAFSTVHEFSRIKVLSCELMPFKGIQDMIGKFYVILKLGIKLGRCHKPVTMIAINVVKVDSVE